MRYLTIIIAIILITSGNLVFAQKPVAEKTGKEGSEKLPTVDSILKNYVKAIGGEKAIKQQSTRFSRGTVELNPMNMSGTFETTMAAETKAYTKLNIAGVGDMIEASDGKSGWSVSAIQGSRTKTPAELIQANLTNDFYRDIRLTTLFPKIDVTGIEKVNGKDAYVVKATPQEGPAETWYFDKVSFLIIRSDTTIISPEGDQPISVYSEDFRSVDGIQIPFKIRSKMPQFEIVLTATEVKHGVKVDDSLFAKPKQ